MSKIITAQEHGYKTAKGDIGTGWMAYSEGDVLHDHPELKGVKNRDILREKANDWAEGWEETNQWEYETQKIRPKAIIDGKINEEWIDFKMDWFMGYALYILEVEGW